jgi:hypothetical protein
MKNKNYNFNLNPKDLSSQEINKHKDFDALLQQVSTIPAKKPFNIKVLYYLAGSIAAALLGVFLYFGLFADQGMTTQQYLASQAYVNPPFENIKPTYEKAVINVNQGGEYIYESGSKITVPPAAFVDNKGELVNGEVDIKYREFHDFIDFFLSGIPMEYDSAGVNYALESAGMVEIFAEQNGIRLNVAPGKEIHVELVSEIMIPATDREKIPAFNIYKLDEGKRNWVYKGQDDIEFIEDDMSDLLNDSISGNNPNQSFLQELAQIEQKENAELAAIESNTPKQPTPLKPERANGSDYVFNFDFTDETLGFRNTNQVAGTAHEEINQLRKQYANTLWQVAPDNPDFNEEMVSQIAWEDMKLEQINSRDYELTLLNPNKEIKVIVNPVLNSQDYDAALEEFNQDFAIYKTQIAEREEVLRTQKEALDKRIKLEREVAKKKYEEMLAIYKANGRDDLATNLMVRQKVINRFSASSLGTWNCDRPLPPAVYRLKGEFVDNKSTKYNQEMAYLVDKNKNTVYRFYAKEKANVLYNKFSENLLWIVTRDNKLAIFPAEKFKNIDKKEGDYTFVMDLHDETIASEEDVRRILQF